MTNPIVRGKAIFILIALFSLGFSALSITLYIFAFGPEKILTQLFRFCLNLLMLILIYRGDTWTKWVLGVYFLMATVEGLVLPVAPNNPTASIVMLVVSILYALAAYNLLFSKSITEFMKSQREKRTFNPSKQTVNPKS